MKMNGAFFANKNTNNKAAQFLLLLIFAQSVGLLSAIGLNLGVAVLSGISAFSLVLIFGSLWLVWGIRKHLV